MLNGVSDLHSVLYHESGSDFLTYESFARDIVLGHSLNGGESVFDDLVSRARATCSA